MFRLLPFLALAAVVPATAADPPAKPAPHVTWKKTVLDRKFRSEGVAVADVNKDGKVDVLNGEYWYEAPDWTPHELQPPMDHKDGLGNYSRVFACWADDLNADGYPDLIVIDFPGVPCYWMENPKGGSGHWKKHQIWHSACNETPLYTDLLGTGQRVLVMGFQPEGKGPDANEGQMAYFTPDPNDPTAKWQMHPISEPSMPNQPVPGTFKFSHGLGVGDVNKDGRNDVVCTGGWWEQPAKADGKTPWAFHPANLGAACADMYVYDVDGDGVNDVLSTSAHQFGVWYHKQVAKPKQNEPAFQTVPLFGRLTSETHAAHFVDVDGDGLKDLVTGKRWWSHGRSEPGSSWDARIYWLKAVKEKDGFTNFVPMLIDDDSGIGTQFEVADVNGDGLLDIISSNKKGVRVIVQERK
ncbi:MAG: VCBS repeat-containing protein [Gemmataceae bacterium]|nr:VCBS repeat-containing protein [Gemmataceae bacterium]